MSEFSGIESLSAGDIFLYRTTSMMGRAIRLLDGTEVSHAALYLGDEVAEALFRPGLVQRPIEESIDKKDTNWVAVMQMRPVPGPMTPVLQVAQNYLDQGNRYGYEQILLLAGICLTRKLDIDNPLLRRMVQTAMRKAVDLIDRLHGEGKEPMICSEFVFRTYDEAQPEPDDPYSLEILSQAGTPRRFFSRFRQRRGRYGAPAQPESPVIHPESLLGRLEKAGETVESLPATGVRKSAMPPADEDIEALVEQYVAQTEGRKVVKSLPVAAADVSTDELLDTARLFASEMAASAARKDDTEKTLYGAPPTAAKPAKMTFCDIIADFVTPGDLLKSPSLERVGTLEP
jgi:hypothetical protein